MLVWNRRLRPWVIGVGVAFHLGIDLFLDIGFFSIAIYLAYLAFLPDDARHRIVADGADEPPTAAAGPPGCRRADRRATQARWRSSQPRRTATARGSWRSAVAGAVHDAELGVAVGVDEDAGVEDGDEVVVAAVDHEQRAGRELRAHGDRPELAQLAGPGVDVGRERGSLDDADLAGVLEEALRVRGPVVEVGGRAEGGDPADLRVGGRRGQRQRATRAEARPATRR